MLETLLAVALILPAPDYTGVYAKGISFAQWLEEADQLKDEWVANSGEATVEVSSLARAKALQGQWRLLVVAEPSCHDSVGTVPYLAKFADASPDTLSLHIVRKAVGLAVMEAHRTVDGRAATPTIVVLAPDGTVKGAIAERPAALLAYLKEHTGSGERRKWYEEDKGRHAILEILDIIER
jgi:hypothetical protein